MKSCLFEDCIMRVNFIWTRPWTKKGSPWCLLNIKNNIQIFNIDVLYSCVSIYLGNVFLTYVSLSSVKEIREVEILFSVSLTVLGFEIRRNYKEERSIKYLESSLFSILTNKRDEQLDDLLTKNVLSLIRVIHMSLILFFYINEFLIKNYLNFSRKNNGKLSFHRERISYQIY